MWFGLGLELVQALGLGRVSKGLEPGLVWG